ncbi:MAG: trypsin-like peptidase domain-containing protein [Pirellulaceae bacterium]|nr:trypsin-like peptidase domain-containing protein [Pirellulaceae bacterium]
MTLSKKSRSWRQLVLNLGLGTSLSLSGQTVWAEGPTSNRYTATVLAIQQAEPAVVNIEGNKPAAPSGGNEGQLVNGMGAGVIVDSRGYILTNQHVVQDVSKIEVTLHDGTQLVGRLIDRDAETDLALIKVDPKRKLPVIRCGTSSDLMRGEHVIAIGNPYGYHHSVTEGIISALHRDIPVNGVQEYPDLIQTDASINPGNSGGPLLNSDGEMIGINAAVRIGAQGIGFAIPVDRAIDIAARMVANHRRNRIEGSIEVETVYANGESRLKIVSASGNKDLGHGDIVTKINGQAIKNRLDYELAMIDVAPNGEIELEYSKDGVTSKTKLVSRSSQGSRTQLVSSSSSKVTAATSADAAYNLIGVRLEVADASKVRAIDASYKGGLKVVSVKPNSPAFNAQIKPGDVLVGLLDWQTPNWDDLAYIFNSNELKESASPKFHIMRGRELFWGNFDIGTRRTR